MERWPLGSTSETGVLALADTSASSLDEANLPCYELIRCVEHGTLNQRRQDLANPLHSLRRLKFKLFFIDWLLQAFAFQLQCRCTVSWRWWTSQLTVRVLVFSHLLTSVLGINSTYLRNHHQVTSTSTTTLNTTTTTTDRTPEAIDFHGIIAHVLPILKHMPAVGQQCVKQR